MTPFVELDLQSLNHANCKIVSGILNRHPKVLQKMLTNNYFLFWPQLIQCVQKVNKYWDKSLFRLLIQFKQFNSNPTIDT
jgi:hypothetical protein